MYLILKGVCTDLGSAQNLIITICEQFNLMRDENLFKELFRQAVVFRDEHDIDMNGFIRTRRQKPIPSRFKDCIVTASLGHRNYNTNEENMRLTMYFPAIDSMSIELNERFPCHHLEIAKSVASLSSVDEKFLAIETLETLISHLLFGKKM
jgi:hypothetical protein